MDQENNRTPLQYRYVNTYQRQRGNKKRKLSITHFEKPRKEFETVPQTPGKEKQIKNMLTSTAIMSVMETPESDSNDSEEETGPVTKRRTTLNRRGNNSSNPEQPRAVGRVSGLYFNDDSVINSQTSPKASNISVPKITEDTFLRHLPKYNSNRNEGPMGNIGSKTKSRPTRSLVQKAWQELVNSPPQVENVFRKQNSPKCKRVSNVTPMGPLKSNVTKFNNSPMELSSVLSHTNKFRIPGITPIRDFPPNRSETPDLDDILPQHSMDQTPPKTPVGVMPSLNESPDIVSSESPTIGVRQRMLPAIGTVSPTIGEIQRKSVQNRILLRSNSSCRPMGSVPMPRKLLVQPLQLSVSPVTNAANLVEAVTNLPQMGSPAIGMNEPPQKNPNVLLTPGTPQGSRQLSNSEILQGVVAYVDVCVGKRGDNRSRYMASDLVAMGAKVLKRLTDKVTHVVFKDGSQVIYEKAKKMENTHIVGVLWVEACREQQRCVEEDDYPPACHTDYDDPFFKRKKPRVLVLNREDEIAKLEQKWEKLKKKQEKERLERQKKREEEERLNEIEAKENAQKTPKNNVLPPFVDLIQKLTPISPARLREIIDADVEDIEAPLARRVLNRLWSNKQTSLSANLNGADSTNGESTPKKTMNGERKAPLMPTVEDNTFVNDAGSSLSDIDLFEEDAESSPAPDILVSNHAIQQVPTVARPLLNDETSIVNPAVDFPLRPNVDPDSFVFPQPKRISSRHVSPSPTQKRLQSISEVIEDVVQKYSQEECITPKDDSLTSTQNSSLGRKLLPRNYNIGPMQFSPVSIARALKSASSIVPEHRKNLESRKSLFKPPPRKSVMNRRSIDEFIIDERSKPPIRRSSQKKILLPSIVCTSMHSKDVEILHSLVKAYGHFVVQDSVNESTTHVIAGATRRTLNMLRAITLGCWIVQIDWMFKSLESGNWIEEEPYELTEFSPAVKQCRIDRLAFGTDYISKIFEKCGAIFIHRSSRPPDRDLNKLVKSCGGTIAPSKCRADIIVGSNTKKTTLPLLHVNEKWILDSVQYQSVQPTDSYIIDD